MQISIPWLKEFVPIEESPEQLSSMLTMLGLEVEETANKSALKDLIVGTVLSKRQHPNADNLCLCEINDGQNIYPVVCGAPNVDKGQKIVFAPIGSELPGGLKIGKVKIRGEVSLGMICSEKELGLSENHKGIMVLSPSAETGLLFSDYLRQTQSILDLDLTPNRSDCFSHLGVARDISVKTGRILRKVNTEPRKYHKNEARDLISIEIDDLLACPRYTAGIVKNVKVGPSPPWLSEKLESIGQRSINNIVDISNYVMQEMGQPTHIFDFDKIDTGKIQIRMARQDESIITLDNLERKPAKNHLLITNGSKALALAGLMGGLDSAVNSETSTVLVESAYFDPPTIRRAAKSLGLSTDASKRFERGADPEGTLTAFWRVLDLLEEITGGQWVPGLIDEYPRPLISSPIILTKTKIKRLSGCDINNSFIEKTLTGLGLKLNKTGAEEWSCLTPSFRPDLKREVDLIEEILRIYGYSQVPSKIHYSGIMENEKPDPRHHLLKIQDSLNGLGFSQCLNNSLTSKSAVEITEIPAVKVMNPLTEDMTCLRTTLLEGLIKTADYNIKNGNVNLRLYEWGNVFTRKKPGLAGIRQQGLISGIMHGEFQSRSVHNTQPVETDFFILKGSMEHLFDSLKIKGLTIVSDNVPNPFYSSTYSLSVNNKLFGTCGKLSASFIKNLNFESGPLFAFELFLDLLFIEMEVSPQYNAPNLFPKIERDLNFVVDDTLETGKIVELIRKNAHEHKLLLSGGSDWHHEGGRYNLGEFFLNLEQLEPLLERLSRTAFAPTLPTQSSS
ncbi:MAG: phenylalanine--tRNA ligase subunit beta, partial [Candidatus Neomarinimicrobiota bacterium]